MMTDKPMTAREVLIRQAEGSARVDALIDENMDDFLLRAWAMSRMCAWCAQSFSPERYGETCSFACGIELSWREFVDNRGLWLDDSSRHEVVMVDPGDIDVDEPLGVQDQWPGLISIWEPLGVQDTPYITAGEVLAIQERMYEGIAEPLAVPDTPYMNLRLYEMIADSFGVPPAAVDINRCSLEEWAARVDALVREVI
jgi:hypothetical protein